MLKKSVIFAAGALVACSDKVNQDDVINLLQSNDPRVCVSSEVQSVTLSAISDRYADYISSGGIPISFEAVNSSGVNKEVNEISCSAMINFPSRESEVFGTISERKVAIAYTVRPSLSEDGNFVVNFESPDKYLKIWIDSYIENQENLKQILIDPASSGNSLPDASLNFSAPEMALIASANNEWSDYRNGKSGAEERFDKLLNQLFESGVCWGKTSQSQVEYNFHRCGPDSIQK